VANENLKEAKIQQIIDNLAEKKETNLDFCIFSDKVIVKVYRIFLQSKLLSLFGRITIFLSQRFFYY